MEGIGSIVQIIFMFIMAGMSVYLGIHMMFLAPRRKKREIALQWYGDESKESQEKTGWKGEGSADSIFGTIAAIVVLAFGGMIGVVLLMNHFFERVGE